MEVLVLTLRGFDFIHQFITLHTFSYFIYWDQLGAEFCLEIKKENMLSAPRCHFVMRILIYSYIFSGNLDNFVSKR